MSEKHIRESFENYINSLCLESLESIEATQVDKNSWAWEYSKEKYRASVVKIGDSYDFMFGADRNGSIVTGDTHAGNPLRVFAGALSALKQFVELYRKPLKWHYYGFIGREKLYDKFASRIEKELPYDMVEKYKEDWVVYYIFNRRK